MCDFKDMDLKNTHNLLKAQIFLFFSEALSMCNQIRNKNTDNPAKGLNKSKLKNTCRMK